jgi:hypothetical protein
MILEITEREKASGPQPLVEVIDDVVIPMQQRKPLTLCIHGVRCSTCGTCRASWVGSVGLSQVMACDFSMLGGDARGMPPSACARLLRREGSSSVAGTRGARFSILIDGDGSWWARALLGEEETVVESGFLELPFHVVSVGPGGGQRAGHSSSQSESSAPPVIPHH